MQHITIKGVRLHNLKNIDISIPKNRLVVVTGISGSGKTSLVFDIIFEEGRRQYLQSLGILAGTDHGKKFDSISGLAPAIVVQQNIIRQSNPRSTAGTKTQLLNMLGILYAGEGRMSCMSCGISVDDNMTCRECGYKAERLSAACFSYNALNGMCIKCAGRGGYFELDYRTRAGWRCGWRKHHCRGYPSDAIS